ncbi:hypothetical protein [Nocardioides lijunqiniae]|uniref:hypothetical protein n=1 Tax=Nocardioides lijunqiniae TaxID=2760832 RepID=UPI001877B721|nr:hypothetical protein [Nocardioides lijunqiniae]
MDAKGVDRPLAVVAGLRPDVGRPLVRDLLDRGYEVWADRASVPEAGLVPPGRVHRLPVDIDTDGGCELVLHTLAAVRRPVAAVAVGVVPGSPARRRLVGTLHQFLMAWGSGRLLLASDARDGGAWRSWRHVRAEARALRTAQRESEVARAGTDLVTVGTLLMVTGPVRTRRPGTAAARALFAGRDRVVRAGLPGA